MATRYWMISLPLQTADDAVAGAKTALWARLQESISRRSFDTPLYRFTVPDLRPGTLDSLLALSDDLVKSNIFIEGVSHKIRRQIEDLDRAGGNEAGALTVDPQPNSALRRSLQDRLSKAASGRGRAEEIPLRIRTSTAPSLKLIDLPGLDQRVVDDSMV